MTITEFIRNPSPALDKCDAGKPITITRRGKVYEVKLVAS